MGTTLNTRSGAPQKALVAGDIALSAGWGTAPVLAITAGSTVRAGELTITCDATAGASPTVTITFPEGAAPEAPWFLTNRTAGGDDQTTVPFEVTTRSTTAVVFTFKGTPVDTKIYVFAWQAMGR